MLEPYAGTMPHVDPSAFVHRSAVIIGDVRLGADSSVWPNATLRGDDGAIVIGARTSIQDGSVVHMTDGMSTVSVGDQVTIGHGVILHGCTVGDDCIIGMGAIILDNAVIERGSIVGAGAVIPMGKRVTAGSVVVGNPFTVIRECSDKDAEWIRYSWNAYVDRGREFRAAQESQG